MITLGIIIGVVLMAMSFIAGYETRKIKVQKERLAASEKKIQSWTVLINNQKQV